MTQNNLGNALAPLGDREAGTETLSEAVAAYRAALEERTCDRVPLDWAATTANMALARGALAERAGNAAEAGAALADLDAALALFREAGAGGYVAPGERMRADLAALWDWLAEGG